MGKNFTLIFMYNIYGISFIVRQSGNYLSVLLRGSKDVSLTSVIMPVRERITKAGILGFLRAKLDVPDSSISFASNINFDIFEGLS